MKFLVVDDEKDVEMLFRQKFRSENHDQAMKSGAKSFSLNQLILIP